MRQRAPKPVFHPRRHQHQVIRSGRDSGDEGEGGQRPENFGMDGQRDAPRANRAPGALFREKPVSTFSQAP
jgi:hypothetical protein